MRIFLTRKRPVHLSPFPLERLRCSPIGENVIHSLRDSHRQANSPKNNILATICREYCEIYHRFRDGAVAAEKASYLEDPQARSNELKSMALFFDSTLVGASDIPTGAWLDRPIPVTAARSSWPWSTTTTSRTTIPCATSFAAVTAR